jgi:hypothetical protein
MATASKHMGKGILCTIDFSESSRQALCWSVALAKQLDAHLSILYTFRLFNVHNGEVIEMKRKIEREAQEKFQSLEKECLLGKGISYDFKTEVGFISNRVKDHTNKNEVGFLVMSNKMNASNKESFDELAESIKVPLVIVP